MLRNEVTIGDIVTFLAIVPSAAAIVHAIAKTRGERQTAKADRVRAAVGAISAKLERMRHLSLSLYERIQPLIVDVGHKAASSGPESARDLLWKETVRLHADLLTQIADENIETEAVPIAGYNTELYHLITVAITALRETDDLAYRALLAGMQSDLLERSPVAGSRVSTSDCATHIGNTLRMSCSEVARRFDGIFLEILDAFQSAATVILEASDDILASRGLDKQCFAPANDQMRSVFGRIGKQRDRLQEADIASGRIHESCRLALNNRAYFRAQRLLSSSEWPDGAT